LDCMEYVRIFYSVAAYEFDNFVVSPSEVTGSVEDRSNNV